MKPRPGRPGKKISALTLEHYETRAEDFREGTRDHDVSQNIEALLRHIAGEPPFTILDFRLRAGARSQGVQSARPRRHRLEGAARFVAMARAESGCEVWQQDFLKLDLPEARFDGVFANAALFHVPCRELPRVLRQLRAALKPGGVLFCSNPRGQTRKAGTAAATARTTIWPRGAAGCRDRDSSSSSTTTGPPDCRASSSVARERVAPAGGLKTRRPRRPRRHTTFKWMADKLPFSSLRIGTRAFDCPEGP